MENNLIYWAKRLYNAGLSPAKSGNISIRAGNGILITTSGSACADLSENEIVEIDFTGRPAANNKTGANPCAGAVGTCQQEGSIYSTGENNICAANISPAENKEPKEKTAVNCGVCTNKKPSSEKFMHIKIYEKRPDIKAIIHSHSPAITAFTACGLEINKPILPEFAFSFGEIPLAKYYLPSSIELANCVAEKFGQNNAVLMENHGVVVGGASLAEAFYSLEAIHAYAKTFLYAKLLGGAKPLSKSSLKDIEKLKSSF